MLSSPRPWRCFYCHAPSKKAQQVFSTSVEVFPTPPRFVVEFVCLLHVRGGVSNSVSNKTDYTRSSPRPWRCFYTGGSLVTLTRVFSTSVEVFPRLSRPRSWTASLLHVRGGVSAQMMEFNAQQRSSPRPWRCFLQLLPSWNSVLSLLHVRGGVSPRKHRKRLFRSSSPRPWRCFLISKAFTSQMKVFFTSVEVFPRASTASGCSGRLLHDRGGVSYTLTIFKSQNGSSPRPWRCFA